MKKGFYPIAVIVLTCIFLHALAASAAAGTLSEAAIDSVFKVEGKKDLFRSTHFYFGGQPTLETLQWLKSEGVTVVVNLRSEKENKEFADASFNEESVVKDLGMAYVSIPMGDKEAYCPATVDKFADALKAQRGKAFIHCLSAGRATYLWMAYLVRHRDYSLDEAADAGRRIKYPTQLEDLLGVKLSPAIAK
jgi:protein tyrosine phosphatase (PTP) superfamily phosphohydrolase (DUF442 family)